jgi:hypothetical protein
MRLPNCRLTIEQRTKAKRDRRHKDQRTTRDIRLYLCHDKFWRHSLAGYLIEETDAHFLHA